MSSPNPHVGIVILNWRRPECTLACLESLQHLDYPCFEVVVVDNGSGDGSTETIRQRFPRVTVIENGRNLGFATGCNIGITQLLGCNVDYVLLLNDDTEADTCSLRHLVEVAESDPAIGIVGPKICYYGRPETIWSAGGTIDQFGEARHRRVDQTDECDADEVQDVDYVTGCALLIKRKAIETIGLLDDRFFAYFEEAEWCARARRRGFRVVYAPRACVWHKIEAAERTDSWGYIYLMTRNRLLYLKCIGAKPWTTALAIVDLLRTALSWSLKPRHRHMRPYSSALTRGIRDFVTRRFGPPPLADG
ncbi:MAG: glycosyltransferase family 2 protein [Chloroflexota bacterium]